MKLLFAILAATVMAITPLWAKTVLPPRNLNISLTNNDPTTYMNSFIHSPFHAGPLPSFVNLRTETWFPPGNVNSNQAMVTWWTGYLNATKVTPRRYQLSGTLSASFPHGMTVLDFNPNGKWTCAGDCRLYTYWAPTGQYVPSASTLLSGEYTSYELPTPAPLTLALSALAALFALWRPARKTGPRPALI